MQIDATIRNIIFDLGGVILNIDYRLTQKSFEKLGVKDFKNIYSQKDQVDLFNDFETGKISSMHFRRELKKIIPEKISDAAFDRAWNAMLLDLPGERLELLKKLRKKYRIFLLSNTNEIHIRALSAYLKKNFEVSDLKTFFEKTYLSFEIGLRKPHQEIFELVLRENNLQAEETLFMDDSIQHVESAAKLGIRTILIQRAETIVSIFN